MKTPFKILAIISVLFLGTLSCTKPTNESGTQSTAGTLSTATLVAEANDEFMATNIAGGTETEELSLTNDGMPDVYQLEDNSLDETFKDPKQDHGKGLRNCIKNLNLDKEQWTKLVACVNRYAECKSGTVARIREASKEMMGRYEAMRKEYIAKVKEGKLSKAEFEKLMSEKREALNKEMTALKLKEAEALKSCYEKFLANLSEILTPEQLKAFISCFSHGPAGKDPGGKDKNPGDKGKL